MLFNIVAVTITDNYKIMCQFFFCKNIKMGYKLMILAGVTTLVSEVLQDISYNTIRSIIGYLYLGLQIYLNDVCKDMKGIQIHKEIN